MICDLVIVLRDHAQNTTNSAISLVVYNAISLLIGLPACITWATNLLVVLWAWSLRILNTFWLNQSFNAGLNNPRPNNASSKSHRKWKWTFFHFESNFFAKWYTKTQVAVLSMSDSKKRIVPKCSIAFLKWPIYCHYL